MAIGWGIVGLEGCTDRTVAPATRQAKDIQFVGIVSRDKARAEQFAKYHDVEHAYDNLEDLLARRQRHLRPQTRSPCKRLTEWAWSIKSFLCRSCSQPAGLTPKSSCETRQGHGVDQGGRNARLGHHTG